MARLMRPLASLLAVVTTAATPAVLAACLALCLPGMRGHVMAAQAAPAVSVTASDAGCPDHAVAAPVTPATAVAASAAACCTDALAAGAPSVTVERTGTRHALAGVLVPFVAWTPAPLPRVASRLAYERGSPPPPFHRPAVLRI